MFLKRKIILFICFHNITKGQGIISCPYIVVFRAILFLTHVLLYTLFVLSQVECKQFVSIFISIRKRREIRRIILSCFCKSATGCVVCVNRAVVYTAVSHIDIPGFPRCGLYVVCHMIQLRLYHVMSCQSLAPYIWNYTSMF